MANELSASLLNILGDYVSKKSKPVQPVDTKSSVISLPTSPASSVGNDGKQPASKSGDDPVPASEIDLSVLSRTFAGYDPKFAVSILRPLIEHIGPDICSGKAIAGKLATAGRRHPNATALRKYFTVSANSADIFPPNTADIYAWTGATLFRPNLVNQFVPSAASTACPPWLRAGFACKFKSIEATFDFDLTAPQGTFAVPTSSAAGHPFAMPKVRIAVIRDKWSVLQYLAPGLPTIPVDAPFPSGTGGETYRSPFESVLNPFSVGNNTELMLMRPHSAAVPTRFEFLYDEVITLHSQGNPINNLTGTAAALLGVGTIQVKRFFKLDQTAYYALNDGVNNSDVPLNGEIYVLVFSDSILGLASDRFSVSCRANYKTHFEDIYPDNPAL